MKDLYESLGFKTPDYVENQYGIRIYLGTKYCEDWCIEIPKNLAQRKCPDYNLRNNLCMYFVTEEYALNMAKEYTELAEKISEEKLWYERY